MKLSILTVGLAAALAAACASKPLPTARVVASEAAVRSAAEMGAASTPEAALHLKMATDQLTKARGLINDGEYDKAEWLLVRSKSDAELAMALTREAKAKAAANEASGRVRQVAGQQMQQQQQQMQPQQQQQMQPQQMQEHQMHHQQQGAPSAPRQ